MIKKIIILNLFIGGIFFCANFVNAASMNDEVNFFVDAGYDVSDRSQIKATLRVIGEHIYFYIENEYWNNLSGPRKNVLRSELENLVDEFDHVIYPKERSVFGSEWNPGIDNDSRITVLVAEMLEDIGGYININDEYPRSQIANSNEREMIYLNTVSVFDDKNKAFLAHEFQHLISFYQKTVLYNLEEDVWLNEARSEYAPTLCGYNNVYLSSYLAERVDALLETPSDSLTEWKNEFADYGGVSLFIHYLVDHYGAEILTKMVLNNKVGVGSINQALADLGYSETLEDVFTHWVVSLYLNNCLVSPQNQYCYLDDNLAYSRLHTDYTASYSGFPNVIVTRSSPTKDWTPRWYRFNQGSAFQTDRDTLKLEFAGAIPGGDFIVPYIITSNGQSTVGLMSIDEYEQGEVYVSEFSSKNKSLIIAPFNSFRKNHFTGNDPTVTFTFSASSISELAPEPEPEPQPKPEPELPDYPDGSLLRAKGGYKVYIINGKYKRWIQSAAIFNAYGHLKWEDVIEVDAGALSNYTESWLIRAWGDKKVYELNADGAKHWLNITAEQFSVSGRLWDMVYIVNNYERDWYKTGTEVKK